MRRLAENTSPSFLTTDDPLHDVVGGHAEKRGNLRAIASLGKNGMSEDVLNDTSIQNEIRHSL